MYIFIHLENVLFEYFRDCHWDYTKFDVNTHAYNNQGDSQVLLTEE